MPDTRREDGVGGPRRSYLVVAALDHSRGPAPADIIGARHVGTVAQRVRRTAAPDAGAGGEPPEVGGDGGA